MNLFNDIFRRPRPGERKPEPELPPFPETLPCECCDTMWDYVHTHRPWTSYGDYFRWLEKQVTKVTE